MCGIVYKWPAVRKGTAVLLSLNKDGIVNLAAPCWKCWRFFDTILIN